MPADDPREVLFEFVRVGSVVKAIAMDSATGIEVSVMGPTTASQASLQQLAVQKLKARLAREGKV